MKNVFEYKHYVFVTDEDFEDMENLVIEHDYSIEDAFYAVSCRWDDIDFFACQFICDDVTDELERRLNERKEK